MVAAPSGERKGGECPTYLSEPNRPPRVFIGCGNLGLRARHSLGTEVMALGSGGLAAPGFYSSSPHL